MPGKSKTKPQRPATRGNMKPTEIRPLVLAAREAHLYQVDLGNTEADFDTWRRDQVRTVTGHAGLTTCCHQHFQPLMAHFKQLAGRDDQAFAAHLKTGAASRDPHDTHEARRNVADQLVSAVEHHQARRGEINLGYVVSVTRHKTRRPRLNLGTDLRAGLAERCTLTQLEQIRNTVANRIAAKEGRGETRARNKSQRR